MPDVFTRAKRSEVMSRIRSRGNKGTEVVLAKMFRLHGITGWRRHHLIRIAKIGIQKKAGGRAFAVRPDFVFPKHKLAVFVDGCFWHGCPVHGTRPKGNRPFWDKKLAGNRRRDLLVTGTLRSARWRVLRLWEHQLNRPSIIIARVERILASILERNK